MKLVTFSRDMAPHGAGDTRLVPDDVADRLADEGAVSNVRPFPPEPPKPAHRPGKRYLSRKA
jgi:hypothetical protein